MSLGYGEAKTGWAAMKVLMLIPVILEVSVAGGALGKV